MTVEQLTRAELTAEANAAMKRGVGTINRAPWTINERAGTVRDATGELVAYVNPDLFRASTAILEVDPGL